MQQTLDHLISRYPELTACEADIREAFQLIRDSYRNGGKVLLCGNGGSAADCDHIVGELMKGFMSRRPVTEEMREQLKLLGQDDGYLADHLQGALPAISLVSHSALISAFSNDVAADLVFAQQVFGYGNKGDVLIGFSTSGNSVNVIRALQVARTLGLSTVGFTGRGGKMNSLCDVAICVPADSTPDVQERHLPIYHALCIMLEKEFF